MTSPKLSPPTRPDSLTWLGAEWDPSWTRQRWHPFGAVAGLFCAGGQYAARTEHLHWGWGIPIGLALCVVAVAATAGRMYAGSSRAYFWSAALVASVWLVWALAVGDPYAKPVLIIALGALIVYQVTYGPMRRAQRRHEDRQWDLYLRECRLLLQKELTASAAPEEVLKTEFELISEDFAAAGFKNIKVHERRATPCGPSYLIELPATVSVDRLADKQGSTALANVWDVGEGSIRIDPERRADGFLSTRYFRVYIDVENILRQPLPMPDEHGELSILQAFPYGRHVNGDTMHLSLVEIHTMIAAMTGGGKSNLLHLLIHQVSRCSDAILWGIDLKGGQTLRPWLLPWLRGETAHPIFDWVATTRLQALRMLLDLKTVCQMRPEARTGNKWRPTRAHPAIIGVFEEFAQVVGKSSGGPSAVKAAMQMVNQATADDDAYDPPTSELQELYTSILQLARSAAAWIVGAVQRTTVTSAGEGDAQANIAQIIGGRVADPGEGRMVFDDMVMGQQAATFTEPGSHLIKSPKNSRLAWKAFFLGDDDELETNIRRAAIAHDRFHTDLDYETASELRYWHDRWTNPDTVRWLEKAAKLYGTGPLPPLPGGHRPAVDTDDQAAPVDLKVPATDDGPSLSAAELFRRHTGLDPSVIHSAAPPAEADAESDENTPEHQRRYRQFLGLIESYSQAVPFGKLLEDCLALGLVTERRRTQIYRWIDRGETDGLVKKLDGGAVALYWSVRQFNEVAARATNPRR